MRAVPTVAVEDVRGIGGACIAPWSNSGWCIRTIQLNAHVSHAVAKEVPRGWQLAKASGGGNVDAVIALAMAVDRASRAGETRAEDNLGVMRWLALAIMIAAVAAFAAGPRGIRGSTCVRRERWLALAIMIAAIAALATMAVEGIR